MQSSHHGHGHGGAEAGGAGAGAGGPPSGTRLGSSLFNKLRNAVPLNRADSGAMVAVDVTGGGAAPLVRTPTARTARDALAAVGLGGSFSGAPSPTLTLVDQIGGPDVLKTAVEGLVDRLFEDQRIGHFFRNVSKTMLAKKLRMMFEVQYGDNPVYAFSVQGMYRAHKHFKMGDADFDAFMNNVAAAFAAAGVAATTVELVVAELQPFRDAVIGRGMWDD